MNFTRKDILNKKFKPNVKGYDPKEVDFFLDNVINDYETFEKTIHSQHEKIAKLQENNVEKVKPESKGSLEKIKELEIENTRLKNRLQGIKPGDKPSAENLELLRKINALEEFIKYKGLSEKEFKDFLYKKD